MSLSAKKTFAPGSNPKYFYSVPLACSLEVRSVQVRNGCCLLQSKKGKPLSGAAIDARIAKLVKMGVLFA